MMWKSENEPRQAQSNESKESVRVPFSLARRPKDPGSNDCGLVDWAWFTAAKRAAYKPSGAQGKDPTTCIH